MHSLTLGHGGLAVHISLWYRGDVGWDVGWDDEVRRQDQSPRNAHTLRSDMGQYRLFGCIIYRFPVFYTALSYGSAI